MRREVTNDTNKLTSLLEAIRHVPVFALLDSTTMLAARDAIIGIADVRTTRNSPVGHARTQMFPEEETKRA
jgi:hypothetical protein